MGESVTDGERVRQMGRECARWGESVTDGRECDTWEQQWCAIVKTNRCLTRLIILLIVERHVLEHKVLLRLEHDGARDREGDWDKLRRD